MHLFRLREYVSSGLVSITVWCNGICFLPILTRLLMKKISHLLTLRTEPSPNKNRNKLNDRDYFITNCTFTSYPFFHSLEIFVASRALREDGANSKQALVRPFIAFFFFTSARTLITAAQ